MHITPAFPIVLSAASGTGKTTLSHLLKESMQNIRLSISYTTRQPRGIEVDGEDYHFINQDTFDRMVAQNEFIEWAEVHGNRYGSGRKSTQETLDQGIDVLFDIDVQGGRQLKALFPRSCLIFIVPPSMKELEERLRTRATDTEAVIQRRITAARQEMELGLEFYDYMIQNHHIDSALLDLMAVVRCHRIMGSNRSFLRQSLLSA
jgi:guanylate kinase